MRQKPVSWLISETSPETLADWLTAYKWYTLGVGPSLELIRAERREWGDGEILVEILGRKRYYTFPPYKILSGHGESIALPAPVEGYDSERGFWYSPTWVVAFITIRQESEGVVRIEINENTGGFSKGWATQVRADLKKAFTVTVAPPAVPFPPRGRPQRMTQDREERALLFRAILEQSPHLTQEGVARAAAARYFQKYGGKRPKWTEDTVYNDFAAMGWDWEQIRLNALSDP